MEMTNSILELQLCFVRDKRAWFSSLPPWLQNGDEWNHTFWQQQAGDPYCCGDHVVVSVYYEADLCEPTSDLSVQMINAGASAWLVGRMGESPIVIPAGTPLGDFLRIIQTIGGSVWLTPDFVAMLLSESKSPALDQQGPLGAIAQAVDALLPAYHACHMPEYMARQHDRIEALEGAIRGLLYRLEVHQDYRNDPETIAYIPLSPERLVVAEESEINPDANMEAYREAQRVLANRPAAQGATPCGK